MSISSSLVVSFSRLFALLFVLASFIIPAGAAELFLSNGDHISGDFLRRADGRIYFKSALLGEISVPENQAAVVESPDTPVESLAGLPPTNPGSLPPSSGPGQKNGLASSKKPHTPWHGKIEFGFHSQSGRTDAETFSLRGEAEKKKGPDDYRAEAVILYGKQSGLVDTDRNNADFRWRHELSERIFFQSETSYVQDRIKLIDSDYEENVGFGYRLFHQPRGTMNVGAGVTGQYREVTGFGASSTVLLQLFEDYNYKLNGRLTFVQDSSLLSALQSTNNVSIINDVPTRTEGERQNYRFRFNSTLQGKISERISMNLRFEYEFDNSIVQANARADNRVTTSLGYGF